MSIDTVGQWEQKLICEMTDVELDAGIAAMQCTIDQLEASCDQLTEAEQQQGEEQLIEAYATYNTLMIESTRRLIEKVIDKLICLAGAGEVLA